MLVCYPPGLFDLITVRDRDLISQARPGWARLVLGASTDLLVPRLAATAVA
jgi:hypothetical protein